MPLTLVTPPAVEPMSVADARERLNIGTEVSDTTITAFIKTARQKLEKQYGIAMVNQTWSLVLDRFPGCWPSPYPIETGFRQPEYSDSRWRPEYGNRLTNYEIKIDLAPLKSDAIQYVKYADTDGALQTLDPATYSLIPGDLRSSLVLANQASWPSTAFVAGAVQIQFNSGFGSDGSLVPDTLKTAMCLIIAHLRSLTAQNLFMSLENIPGVLERRFIVGSGAGSVLDAAISSLMQDYVRASL